MMSSVWNFFKSLAFIFLTVAIALVLQAHAHAQMLQKQAAQQTSALPSR